MRPPCGNIMKQQNCWAWHEFMKILDHIKFMFGMDTSEAEAPDTAAPFRERFSAFRNLLDHNNAALAAMADLGEKLTGEYLFDRRYVETKTLEVAGHVGAMIDNLNIVCHNRYKQLVGRHAEITEGIARIVGRRLALSDERLVIPLTELTKESADRVGGKMANLGELQGKAGCRYLRDSRLPHMHSGVFLRIMTFLKKSPLCWMLSRSMTLLLWKQQVPQFRIWCVQRNCRNLCPERSAMLTGPSKNPSADRSAFLSEAAHFRKTGNSVLPVSTPPS